MSTSKGLTLLTDEIVACRRCPRLVEWREQVARDKRASFRDDEYWGRPVPGWGDSDASVVVVGLAPAAHGANRTGRMFTGDRSGEWLYRALFDADYASQPESESRDDGLTLSDVWVTAPVRCAPPENKPTTAERDNCAEWFRRELALLPNARVFIALGQYGYLAIWRHLDAARIELPRPRPKFGHGNIVELADGRAIVMSFHPSQQNTFTGRLTREMFDDVFRTARRLTGPRHGAP